jgi:ribose 5-phosphate isomerase B
MQIIIGSDHAGYDLKEQLILFLEKQGIGFKDFGTHSPEPTDYPEIAAGVAKSVSEAEFSTGILICASGIGMSMVANKISGIRAALCMSEEMAKFARLHNNANVLVLAGRMIDLSTAERIVQTFLQTDFEADGRHQRRVNKIHDLTER